MKKSRGLAKVLGGNLRERLLAPAQSRRSWLLRSSVVTAMVAQSASPGCSIEHQNHRSPAKPTVEVLHWLASPEERKALSVVKEAFEQQGGDWHEAALPGVGTAQAVLINRSLGGNPPSVFQASVGARLKKLYEHGFAGKVPLPGRALDQALPPFASASSKEGGKYIVVPAFIRGENWMFFNRRTLNKFGIDEPKDWPQFLSAARHIKAQGGIPLALGGEPWQERILFNSVLLGIGGVGFYKDVYLRRDIAAIQSDTMLKVFAAFGQLRNFVDVDSSGRSWSQTARLLSSGKATFFFMGDWAKGQLKAGSGSIGCALAPARESAYVVAIDGFAFPPTHEFAVRSGQRLFAKTLLMPQVQRKMNLLLGTVPVNRSTPKESFDSCAQIAISAMANDDAVLPSTGLFALEAPLSGAIDDTISMFWHSRSLTPQAGAKAFVKTFQQFSPVGYGKPKWG